MQEMNQGDSYVEDSTNGEYGAEGAEATSSDLIFGIPKNIVILGGVGLLVVILVIVLFATRGSSEKEVYVPSEEDMSGFVSNSGTDVVVDSSTNPGDEWVSGSTSDNGYTSNYEEGTAITDTQSDPFAKEEITNSLDSPDSIVTLRKLGYTGDEIELAIELGISYDDLVAEAEALRLKDAEQRLSEIQDKASPEFQQMYNYSVFSLEPQTFEALDWAVSSAINTTGYYVVNADYEKVPTYGYQLLIKCKIANGTFVFMSIEPHRWETLPDSGNIVLGIDYCLYGSTKTNFYITKITEINTTNITVNPEDSGQNLSDIITDYSEDTSNEEDYEDDSDQIWW